MLLDTQTLSGSVTDRRREGMDRGERERRGRLKEEDEGEKRGLDRLRAYSTVKAPGKANLLLSSDDAGNFVYKTQLAEDQT